MVSGTWYNQDGLYLQYGTQKAVPEIGGDYLIYGETREIEQYIPLVPFQLTTSGQPVAAPPTTFSGTTTAAAAGIQSLTTLLPLQLTAPNTGGTTITLSNPQIQLEEVTTETLIGATGGTSITVGLVTTSPGTPNSSFVQVTPNGGTAGDQILKAQPIARFTTAGQRTTYTTNSATQGFAWEAPAAAVAGNGSWVGISMPLVTNAITPLPTSAWISTIAAGTFTNGLIKLRVRYTIYGNIPY
jgi:hypothetical protein